MQRIPQRELRNNVSGVLRRVMADAGLSAELDAAFPDTTEEI